MMIRSLLHHRPRFHRKLSDMKREISTRVRPVALVFVALAITLVMTGCSSPRGKISTSPATSASGNVHLTDYSDNDGPRSTVVLAGAIGDFGQALSVHADGTVAPEHDADLRLILSKGAFLLSIANLHLRIVSAFRSLKFNPTTCSGSVSVTGSAPIVPGSGTGAYRGITGTFTLTTTIDEVVAESSCHPTGSFFGQAIVIAGPGNVSFG